MGYEVENLKKDYGELRKGKDLPSFDELNKDFEIEKIDRKSEILLKNVRKVMMEKVFNFLNFLEMLMNPANAPRMYHAGIKKMGETERGKIEKMYSSFAVLVVESMKVEIDYSDEEEVRLIKDISNIWKEVKQNFKDILEVIQNPGDSEKKRNTGYFG